MLHVIQKAFFCHVVSLALCMCNPCANGSQYIFAEESNSLTNLINNGSTTLIKT